MRSPSDVGAIARAAGDVLERLRAKSPRVHCITNSVAQNFTANVLLALGAQPSMTIAQEEIAHFAAGADALLVNLGTFDRERAAAIEFAVAAAQQMQDVPDAAALDVGDDGLHRAAYGARSRGAADALLQAGL